MIAISRNAATSNFTCNATAATIPTVSSSPSERVRTQRTSSHVSATHISGSMVDVASRCPPARKPGETATAPAAIS
jgi:hypothetical protein